MSTWADKPAQNYTAGHMGHWDDLGAVNSQIHFTAGMQITEKCRQFSEGDKPLMAQQKFAISTWIWVLEPSVEVVRSRLCFSVALPRVSPISTADWHWVLLCMLPVAWSDEHPTLRISSLSAPGEQSGTFHRFGVLTSSSLLDVTRWWWKAALGVPLYCQDQGGLCLWWWRDKASRWIC